MLPNGQMKYFTATQAVDCLTDYRQMTNIVRGIIGATGATVAGLAGAFLLASTTSTGKEINQKFTGSDGSTVLVTGNGDQPKRQILVTYPDGVRASLTIEVYDDGGAIFLTGGTIGNQTMTPGMLTDMQQTLANAGMSNVVLSENTGGKNGDHQYYPKPKTEEITGFPGLKEVRGVGGRPRWVDSKGKIYEWDKQHGAVEVYDKTGKKHLGEFDPKTGKQTKPGDPGRSTPK
jgi:filamentous hemagglutinin